MCGGRRRLAADLDPARRLLRRQLVPDRRQRRPRWRVDQCRDRRDRQQRQRRQLPHRLLGVLRRSVGGGRYCRRRLRERRGTGNSVCPVLTSAALLHLLRRRQFDHDQQPGHASRTCPPGGRNSKQRAPVGRGRHIVRRCHPRVRERWPAGASGLVDQRRLLVLVPWHRFGHRDVHRHPRQPQSRLHDRRCRTVASGLRRRLQWLAVLRVPLLEFPTLRSGERSTQRRFRTIRGARLGVRNRRHRRAADVLHGPGGPVRRGRSPSAVGELRRHRHSDRRGNHRQRRREAEPTVQLRRPSAGQRRLRNRNCRSDRR